MRCALPLFAALAFLPTSVFAASELPLRYPQLETSPANTHQGRSLLNGEVASGFRDFLQPDPNGYQVL
jgi:hypothetical protein